MRRQSILCILVLLLSLFLCCGCGSEPKSSDSAAVTEGEATESEEAAAEEPAATPAEASLLEVDKASRVKVEKNVIGIFEGLEDNHTAIFSFDGAETAYYFDDPAVQEILYAAILGSSYTLSYDYDENLGYVIYQISE